jgi:Protein of unknown function (DUF3570)
MRRAAATGSLMLGLALAAPRLSAAGSSLEYKYQDYRETGDRIRVRSHYALATLQLDDATRLRVRGVIDTITGATPTGQPAPVNSTQVPLTSLEDRRHAIVTDFSRQWSDTTLGAEYAYSNESDYRSRGISLSVAQELNEKDTEVRAGVAYTDDDIQPAFFDMARRKLSRQALVGFTQVLDRNTTLTANLTWNGSDGYLSDPYKLVRKTVEIAPGLSLPLTFAENRPRDRDSLILQAEVLHFVEAAHGSIRFSWRWLDDNHGVTSHTLELGWSQRLAPRWIVRPEIRWYRQSAAAFYYYNLDSTNLVPEADASGQAPYYSSDYRLSRFDSTTLGLKVEYRVDDQWSVDLLYEHYDMQGRDGVTPASAYATANILTVGGHLWF